MTHPASYRLYGIFVARAYQEGEWDASIDPPLTNNDHAEWF